ncbi:methyl-accepting chemotaxis protein [Vitiosangium sp. GDMCC 1.1324]|uniref:methyl-accepting chemotaxis protein n=1 Tax=Vitiosangium sp. (strain GDMCC 1.1324) TaxID=2138576 RepID=UPI000D343107|nr:HAMP domain-containing methyl-accepting chemotaxis protein [Vitiosangium sp. GDMCC 1.1324]PTL78745.1 methyl-accepting chemotaxis protein [Vitiosangium sp. GDMCC 1.1324]
MASLRFLRIRRPYSRGLLTAIVYANLTTAILGGRYAQLTLGEQMVGNFPLFLRLMGVFSLIAVGVAVVLCMRRLRVLRGVEASAGPVEPERLGQALLEVHRLADFAFYSTLALWLLTSVFVNLAMWVGGAPMSFLQALRLSWPGLLFGPLSALLTYCIVTLRARRVVLEMSSQGLSHELAISLAPRRSEIRLRLVIFTAIVVVTPAVLIWDVSSSLANRAFDEVLAETSPARQAELAELLKDEALWSGSALCLLVFGVALAAAYLGGTLLGRPMRQLGEEAHRIAEGDLSRPCIIPAEDEVWAVSAAFSTMRTHLANVLAQLRRAGTRIGSTTEEIIATSARYEAGAAEQASSLDETSATTEELARSARQIAENAGSVAEIAHKTLAAAKGGQASAESFLETMNRMRHDNQAIAAAVARLNKRVQQIGKIVEFINGVADKSDLLALNAELEGTKAGEVGQGFSLVAAEMRRLAENVIESTKEIEGLIEEVQDASGAAVMATEGGVRATETGTTLAQQVSESLRQIVELAGRTSDAVRAISLATQQQQGGTDLLAEAMADILRITQQSHNATKQVISANGDLSSLARDLRGVVERFQIDPSPPGGNG